MPPLAGAEVLVQIAQAEGMLSALGIASGKLTPLMHALSRNPDLRFNGVHHEASAAMAAAACFAAAGRVALALGAPVPHNVALLDDARAGLQDLLIELRSGTGATATDPSWLPNARGWRLAYEACLQRVAAEAALAQAPGRALPADAMVVHEGGHTSFCSNDLTPVAAPRTRFHDPGVCRLGCGLLNALALHALHRQRPVLQIGGDGSSASP